MLAGVGKLPMALRYFLHGHTLLGVISNPANSTVSVPTTNLSGLSIIPLVEVICPKRVSLMHLVLSQSWETISTNHLEYPSPEAM